jgi:MoxR-like ATPase
MAVGASNELPADREELGAVYDRFLLRFEVSYMREETSFEAMLNQTSDTSGPAASTEITAGELSALRNAAANVDPSPIVPEITALRRELSEAGIHASDRRYAKSVPLMAASAVLQDRDTLTAEDLELLADVLWTEPSQRKTVAKVVMERANPQLGKAQDLADEAEEIHTTAMAATEENATDAGTEANKKLRSVQNRLLELRDEATGAGRSSARIDELLTRVGSMNQEVLKRCLGMDL